MPCRNECSSPAVPAPETALSDLRCAYDKLASDFHRLKKECDQATRLLCEVLSESESTEPFNISNYASNTELGQWWAKHKKLDADKREKARLRAEIKKLTKKLELLGK